jgi:hypothetical protein
MPNLRRLSLSGLPIDAGSVSLLAEEKFHNLTRLELANCKLTDESISDLLTSPNMQGLIELNLQGNDLRMGVKPLIDRRILPRLSRCILTENPIASELNQRLARRSGIVVSKK